MQYKPMGFPMNRRIIKFSILVLVSIGLFGVLLSSVKKDSKNLIVNDKNTLTVAFDAKVQSFDPRLIGNDANSQYLEELRFWSLVSFDTMGRLKLRIAQSIQPLSQKSWLIKIEDNLCFANGKTINVDDVLSTYEAILNPKPDFPLSPRRGAFKHIKKIEKRGANGIYIELVEPDASFLNNLIIGILPKEVARNSPPNTMSGYESGPFQLDSVKNNEIIFKKNIHFCGNFKPKMNTIKFKIIPDAGTRYAALVKGDVDLVQNGIDPDKIEILKRKYSKRFQVQENLKQAVTYLGFNFRIPTLQKLEVRKAIAYAIDRESLIKYRFHSRENPAEGFFIPGYPFFKEKNTIKFDPKLSKEIMSKSGLMLPYRISIKVSSSKKANVEAAKSIAISLSKVGFSARVEPLENTIFQEALKKGNMQIWLAPWLGYKDPDHLRFVFASDMVPPHGGNRGHYSNTKLDKILYDAKETNDFHKRQILYNQAQDIISDDIPYVFLWHGLNTVVSTKNVHDFELYSDGRYTSLEKIYKE